MAAIKRQDLDAGEVDLADVIDRSAPPLPPVSPKAEVLRAEFLEPLGLERRSARPRDRGAAQPIADRDHQRQGARRSPRTPRCASASISAPRPSSG